MHQKTKDIQKRYEGFLQTNCLWKTRLIFDLEQFQIVKKSTQIDFEIDDKLRLGKYIERLVSFQLSQESNIEIICENLQIQQDKRTLGELDCIIKKENTVIHLEIIYKFYLYDQSVGITEIEHLVGPNKKDSLIEKLTKLKEKQLPLLYSNECRVYLNSMNLKASEIEQQVYFKAQLFVPFSDRNIQFKDLNNDCICGYYINKKELSQFRDSKFYIPNKKNWIIIPHKNVNWLDFNDFHKTSNDYLERKFSPFCWIKKPNGEIDKFFLVWW